MDVANRVPPRKKLLRAGLLGMSIVAFTMSAATAEQFTLKFWKAPHSPNEVALWEPLIAEFEAANPDIKIEHLVTPWATWAEQYSAGFSSGEPPCVAYMVDWLSGPFANKGVFLDLEEAGYAQEVQDAYGGNWSRGSVGGHQVGIPLATVPRMWMYNTDLFEQAGVEPPEEGWTWDDFVTIARALKAGGVEVPYAIDMTGANFGYQDFLPWLWNAGGDILNEDLTASRVAEPEAYQTIAMIKGWMDEGLAPPIGTYTVIEGENLFMRGGVAMYNMRASVLPQIASEFQDLQYGIIAAPTGPAGTNYNFQDWGYYAIPKECGNHDAAWKWLSFITSKDITERYLEPTGLYPARIDTNLFADDPEAQIFLASMGNTRNFPIHEYTLEILDAWWSEVERSMLGELTPQEASENADEALMDILE